MTDNPSIPDNGPAKQSQEAPRTHAERGPSFATSEPSVQDLSAEIVDAVRKSPGERVTCRRVFDNKYRCNWWSAGGTSKYDNPEMTGQLVTTHRVSRSEMLRVVKTPAGLVIEVMSGTVG